MKNMLSRIIMFAIMTGMLTMGYAQQKDVEKEKKAEPVKKEVKSKETKDTKETPAKEEAKKEGPEAPGKTEEAEQPASLDEVIAKYKDKDFTRKDLVELIKTYSVADARFFPPDQVGTTKNLSQYAEIIKQIVTIKLLEDQVDTFQKSLIEDERKQKELNKDKEKEEQNAEQSVEKTIEAAVMNTKFDYYITNILFKDIKEPNEQDAKDYYEKNKEKFLVPFNFKIRQIFISTYVPYETVEGDTLEGIAEKISKDKTLVDNIITDDDKKEKRWVDPKNRDKEPFKPLEPKEKLLVPMSKEEKEKIKAKMASIKSELKSGADFVELAKKNSSSDKPGEEIGPITPSQKPVLEEIVSAVKKTKVGEVTDIVQTKHGYSLIMVTDKQEEEYRQFEPLKDNIIRALQNEVRKEIFVKALKGALINNPKVKFNKDAFEKGVMNNEDVIVEAGSLKYTYSQFSKDVQPEKIKEAKTSEAKIDLLLSSNIIRRTILEVLTDNAEFTQKDEYKKKLSLNMAKLLVPEYVNRKIDKEVQISDQEVSDYYEKNKENYKKMKEADFRQIGLLISEDITSMSDTDKEAKIKELTNKLNDIKKQINSVQEFEKIAQKYSEDPEAKEKNGFVGRQTINYKGGLDGAFDKLKEGEISEPIVLGNMIYIFHLSNIKEPSIPQLTEIKDNVKNQVAKQKKNEARAKYIDNLLKEKGFVFKPELNFDKKESQNSEEKK